MLDRPRANSPIVVEEPDALELCTALARARRAVVLVEPDEDARVRLRDMIPRMLGEHAEFLTVVSEAVPSSVWVSGRSSLPVGGPICANWASAGAQTALRYVNGVSGASVVEQVGEEASGRVPEIAAALDAQILVHPLGAIPVAARLHAVLGHALERALLEASTPEDLDAALMARGFVVGPFVLQDRLGIDTLLAERREVEARQGGPEPLPLFPRAVAEGRLGRKASVGWHRYPARYGPVEDPLVEDMAEEEAHFAGLPRSSRSAEALAEEITDALDAFLDTEDTPGIDAICASVLGYAPRPAIRPSTTAASSPLPDK